MTSEPPAPAIEVAALRVAFNGTPILRDVSLTLAPGEFAALIGPNGAGKTTLLNCLSGAMRPSGGRAMLAGCPLDRLHVREVARLVGTVPQEFHVPFAYRVREIVSLGRTPYLGRFGALREADEQAIDAALARTDTAYFQHRTFNELSGGERQRVVVALALAQEPRILLLDEPTAHLDLAHQLDVLSLARAVNREHGVTVLAALHDIDLAALFFPRIIVLNCGAIVADGPAAHVVTADLLWEVFRVRALVLTDPQTGAPRVVPELAGNGDLNPAAAGNAGLRALPVSSL
ncbi:MAG: ABC transporter ATP-binding protein [Actinobacteria bacterium]|nr:ABC transporter ATP-binding protein [Actinomycetota bacterium]